LKSQDRAKNAAVSFISRTFLSLQNRVYRIYFLGMLGQFASMNMQMVTTSLLIYRLTDSSALLGTQALANAIPMILISVFGGVLADRVQKKQVLTIGLICSAAISLWIAVSITTGALSREQAGSWWILMASSFLHGIVAGMMLPARQAIIPEIVSRGQIMNAVSLNTLGMNVLGLIAPAAAGFLIDGAGFGAVYYIITALNLYAAVMMYFVPHTSPLVNRTGNILADIRDGFEYARHDKTILLVLSFTLLFVVLSMPYMQLIPIYVDDILKVGAKGMGILMSVSGAGALVGSIVMASLPNNKRGLILLIGGLISGVSLLLFAFSSVWVLSLIFIVFVGLSQTMRMTTGSALLQSYTKPEYMGRVMSVFMMQWGVMSLCTFFAGVIAEVVPVQWVIGSLAIMLIIFSALAMFATPHIRRLD
jgi:MFS transporter, DHA1 family, staphyloferrin A biosynthesis exporter